MIKILKLKYEGTCGSAHGSVHQLSLETVSKFGAEGKDSQHRPLFFKAFSFSISLAMISWHWWNEVVICLNKPHDSIGPTMNMVRVTENAIHIVVKASFSIFMVPIDSSKSQCLLVTVAARKKILVKDWDENIRNH